jgi:outer membrane protein OmpA-like peptidoglycan-associated protein
MVGFLALTANAAEAPVLQVQAAKPGATVEVERVIGNDKVIVSAVDADQKPLLGLGVPDFAVSLAGRTAKVIAVQPLAESMEMPRHIVLLLDNSYSMRQREATKALLAGLGEVLKIIRPIDDVQLVAFTDKQKMTMGGRTLRVQTFKSNNAAALQAFAERIYRDEIIDQTYLYEGMLAGLEIIRAMPATEPRILVVFSDGEDRGSAFKQKDVLDAVQGVGRFNAYAIDYMPGPQTDKFLTEFAARNRGQIFKATSEQSLVPIFQSVASKMEYYYVLSYMFPLTGKLAIVPDSLTIEEIKTFDSSPLLGHIYFAEGSSEIPSQYVRFAGPKETAGFDEQKFRDAMAKYYQVLNIVGRRLVDRPDAMLTLVGCNSNIGKEKGQKKLSTKRAEAVRDYLQTVWNIKPERLSIVARNLPEKPSASRLKEGQWENRRVEIRASEPAILAPVRSTYFTTRINKSALTVHPKEITPGDVASWKMTAANAAGKLAELAGNGAPAPELTVSLPTNNLVALGAGGDIAVKMELQGNKGQSLVLSADPVKVKFIQTSQRLAEKQDVKVQEKYALILFDFNKDTIEGLNQIIVERIAARIRDLPNATVEIIGHTDDIGKEAYNIKLSERRAMSVYKLLTTAFGQDPGDRIRHKGVGPNTPLYVNTLPEARAYNRTVTITLEYLSAE